MIVCFFCFFILLDMSHRLWSVCYLWTWLNECHWSIAYIHAYISVMNSSFTILSFQVMYRHWHYLDRAIISRLGLVKEQGHREGPVFLQTQGLWNDLAAPFNYQPNYNCITLHTCDQSQRMVNKYSHIISTREWKQRVNRPTGDMDVPPISPNLVWTQLNLMWVNNGIFFFFVSKAVSGF